MIWLPIGLLWLVLAAYARSVKYGRELREERDEARAERDELRAALVKWVYADDGYNGNREDRSLRELIPADDWGIKP